MYRKHLFSNPANKTLKNSDWECCLDMREFLYTQWYCEKVNDNTQKPKK